MAPRLALSAGVLVLTAALTVGCQTRARSGSGPIAARPAPFVAGGGGAQTATLVVYGMGCPLCANNVDKQLLKVAGVEKVNVDLGSGRVKVAFAPGVERPGDDKLAKAVSNSGYTLVRIQTP